jgi:hypothetical protein
MFVQLPPDVAADQRMPRTVESHSEATRLAIAFDTTRTPRYALMSSDIEHWRINATVYKDRVEEIHYISDPARNIRRRSQTKVWQVERFLGRGGFGEVRLERNTGDGKARAVKRIATTSTTLSNSECEKELKALLEFSKPKGSRI